MVCPRINETNPKIVATNVGGRKDRGVSGSMGFLKSLPLHWFTMFK
jgi:hypothetical protein